MKKPEQKIIKTVKIKEVRPTSGRVLLALFSILEALTGPLRGRGFLDLFAGTGRVGLEAMDRGAEPVVWVESVRSRAMAIENILKNKDISGKETGRVTVLGLELRRAVAWLTGRGRRFDVVFADPPYHAGWGMELLSVRCLGGLLSRGGVLVVEHSVREALELNPEWSLVSRRDYGETGLSFLERSGAE